MEEQGVQTEILNEVLLQLKSLKDLEIIGISKTENVSLDESSNKFPLKMFAYLESPLKHLLQHSHGTTPGKKVMRMSVVVGLQLPLSAPPLFGLFAVFSLFPKEKPSHNSHKSLVIWALCVKSSNQKK